MSKSKSTRYAVVSKNGSVLKNAVTREAARDWKRNSDRQGLRIYDRVNQDYVR